MTHEEIIRMALEAASEDGTTRPDKNIILYAAKTSKFLERFAQLVRAAEREACAKAVEAEAHMFATLAAAKSLADAIRARI